MNVVKPIAKVKNESYKKNVRFNIDEEKYQQMDLLDS